MKRIVLLLAVVGVSSCASLGRLKFWGKEKVKVVIPEESFKKGMELYRKGKYKDAVKYFKEVLYTKGYGPLAESASVFLGWSYLKMKAYDEAIGELENFLSTYRRTSDSLRAMAHLGLARAYNDKHTNLELDISDIDKAVYHANVLKRLGIFSDEAEKIIKEVRYKKATKLLLAADVYAKLRVFKSVKVYLRTFLKLYPDDPRADSVKRVLESLK